MNILSEIKSTGKQNTLHAKAMAHIQNKLITGELEWGTQVSEEAIAKEIGISRTPVREALQTFTRLGIFRRIPRYGTIVCEPDLREVHELFEMRLALESYVVEQLATSASDDVIDKIDGFCRELKTIGKEARAAGRTTFLKEEINRIMAADLNFHLQMIGSLENTMMIRYFMDTNLLLRIFTSRRNWQFDLHYLAGVYSYHCRILRAIKKRDPLKAKAWIIKHLRHSETGAIELIRELLEKSRRKRSELDSDRILITSISHSQ